MPPFCHGECVSQNQVWMPKRRPIAPRDRSMFS
jgi:hypothetical protein